MTPVSLWECPGYLLYRLHWTRSTHGAQCNSNTQMVSMIYSCTVDTMAERLHLAPTTLSIISTSYKDDFPQRCYSVASPSNLAHRMRFKVCQLCMNPKLRKHLTWWKHKSADYSYISCISNELVGWLFKINQMFSKAISMNFNRISQVQTI